SSSDISKRRLNSSTSSRCTGLRSPVLDPDRGSEPLCCSVSLVSRSRKALAFFCACSAWSRTASCASLSNSLLFAITIDLSTASVALPRVVAIASVASVLREEDRARDGNRAVGKSSIEFFISLDALPLALAASLLSFLGGQFLFHGISSAW